MGVLKIIVVSIVIVSLALTLFLILAYYLGIFAIKKIIKKWKVVINENYKKNSDLVSKESRRNSK